MDFEWDRAKSERNERARGLPFEFATLLSDGPTIECADERRHYGETRLRAIGVVGKACGMRTGRNGILSRDVSGGRRQS